MSKKVCHSDSVDSPTMSPVLIVGDMIPERLKQAKSFGCETIDVKKTAKLGEAVEDIQVSRGGHAFPLMR